LLSRFLTSHLAGLRGCSPATIASYRDAFKLLIAFFGDDRSIPPRGSPRAGLAEAVLDKVGIQQRGCRRI
jgi:hypothetical protein